MTESLQFFVNLLSSFKDQNLGAAHIKVKHVQSISILGKAMIACESYVVLKAGWPYITVLEEFFCQR